MVVVADTSPLNYLLLIGEQNILHALYGSVIVPTQVAEELRRDRAPELVRSWAKHLPAWVEVKSAETSDFPRLDAGEAAALWLALQERASFLLADDMRARLAAEDAGLVSIGTIGILGAAHNSGLIDFDTAVERLRKTSFRIGDEVVEIVRSTILRR